MSYCITLSRYILHEVLAFLRQTIPWASTIWSLVQSVCIVVLEDGRRVLAPPAHLMMSVRQMWVLDEITNRDWSLRGVG